MSRLVLSSLTLRSLRTALAVWLTATAAVLSPRCTLRMRSVLWMRSGLSTRNDLRTRARLPPATAELVRRWLGRPTGPRTLHRVVHLIALIDARLNSTVGGTTGPCRVVVVRHFYVGRLVAAAAATICATRFGAAGARRTIVSDIGVTRTRPIASAGIASAGKMRRLTVTYTAGCTARSAMDLGATRSSRRPVAASGYMIRPTMTGSAVIDSVSVRPTSRSATIGSVNIRSSPGSAVFRRTRSGSHYAST
jgi:hypothetical protein